MVRIQVVLGPMHYELQLNEVGSDPGAVQLVGVVLKNPVAGEANTEFSYHKLDSQKIVLKLFYGFWLVDLGVWLAHSKDPLGVVGAFVGQILAIVVVAVVVEATYCPISVLMTWCEIRMF